MANSILASSIWRGSGSCTSMPWMAGLRLHRSTRASRSSFVDIGLQSDLLGMDTQGVGGPVLAAMIGLGGRILADQDGRKSRHHVVCVLEALDLDGNLVADGSGNVGSADNGGWHGVLVGKGDGETGRAACLFKDCRLSQRQLF